MSAKTTTRSKSNEIRISRVYDAPVAVVWDAWTDPAQVAKWWGPRGFTITTHSKDLRPGGHWAYTMHGPDGTDYANKTIYHEVVEGQKLVYDHGGNDDRPPLFRVTVLFAEKNKRTHMEMTMTLPTPEAAEQTRKFIRQANGNSTWDRLAEYLAKESDGSERFVINRSFEAPIELVYEMWTDPKRLMGWLPPQGLGMSFIEADIRAGGRSFFVMEGQGLKFYGLAHYLELDRPRRLVYRQQFADESGSVSRHPLAPEWPETMLIEVDFTQEEAGPDGTPQTRVTLTTTPSEGASQKELDAFIRERAGMTAGWTGSFDQLERILRESGPSR